ncbi:integrator complex subunit 12 isoform X2 [Dendroctonus ponderosae]
MSIIDLDPHFIRCVGLMYESRKLRKGDSVPLQYILEEAIFQKTGSAKDYTNYFQTQLAPRESEEPLIVNVYEDDGNDSDKDLELDLFKDDLSCVVCNKMDVGVRNRLLECSDCHALYHQECHKPPVSEEDVVSSWVCSNCKSISAKKAKTVEKEHNSKSSSSSRSDSHRHGSSHKSSSDKYKSSGKSSSSSSKSSPSHSSRSDDKKSSSKSSKSSSSKHYSEKRKHD